MLTEGNEVIVSDERMSVADTNHFYNLKIKNFKIKDVGSYECLVELTSSEHINSHVVVFTCL